MQYAPLWLKQVPHDQLYRKHSDSGFAVGCDRGFCVWVDRMTTDEIKFNVLAGMSLGPIKRAVVLWYAKRRANHYQMSADIERQRARDANKNAAHFERLAMIERTKVRSLTYERR